MRLIIPLVAIFLAACSAPDTPKGPGTAGSTLKAGASAPTTGTRATPRPSASSPITKANPAGVWTIGETGEPGPGPVVACTVAQTLTLTLTDARLQGSVATCEGPCAQLEQLDGNYVDGTATLTGTAKGNLDRYGTPVVYLLHYDSASQHLRGTRNGQGGVWAAPFIVSTDDACHPSPTPDVVPTPQEGSVIPISNAIPGN
jgi:hypothetical protein